MFKLITEVRYVTVEFLGHQWEFFLGSVAQTKFLGYRIFENLLIVSYGKNNATVIFFRNV